MEPVTIGLPFGASVNLSFWEMFSNMPQNQRLMALFAIVGWTVLALIFFYMGAEMWLECRRRKHAVNWQWVLLAIDVPPLEIQSPKAVEQIFAHLSGAFISPNVGEKYWQGIKQKWFSLEIISIEGYIQFLIYSEAQFRDLVEAAIYAQYPMAEITEVEDYVDMIPNRYPNETHEMVSVEFGLAAEDPYPIRTYEEFEHTVTKDFMFNDPMAAILENFSRIGTGENFWFQIIIQPISQSWKEKGITLVKSIIAQKKTPAKTGVMASLGSIPLEAAKMAFEAIRINEFGEEPVRKKEEAPPKISDLTPGVKDTIKAIEDKISKIGFSTKARVVYAARKDVFNPSRCLQGFIGSLNQFNYAGRNAIIPKTSTDAYYAFKNYRISELKRKFTANYKKRKIKVQKNPYILNTEELATLWHFPLPLVKTPLLQKAMAKRAEPPINLPIETVEESPLRKKIEPAKEPPKEEIVKPEDLPYG
jgi:hypothetical protein